MFLIPYGSPADIQEQRTKELRMSPPLSLCTSLACGPGVTHGRERAEQQALTPMHLHTSSKTFPCGGVFLYSPLPAMNTTEKQYNPSGNSHD